MTARIQPPEDEPLQPRRSRPGDPLEYAVYPAKRLVVVKTGRVITERVIVDYFNVLRGHPAFTRDFSEIVDARAMEHLDISGERMMQLADDADPFSHDARRAFIVCNAMQEHDFRIYRMVRLCEENMAILHSFEEAEDWIRRGTVRRHKRAASPNYGAV